MFSKKFEYEVKYVGAWSEAPPVHGSAEGTYAGWRTFEKRVTKNVSRTAVIAATIRQEIMDWLKTPEVAVPSIAVSTITLEHVSALVGALSLALEGMDVTVISATGQDHKAYAEMFRVNSVNDLKRPCITVSTKQFIHCLATHSFSSIHVVMPAKSSTIQRELVNALWRRSRFNGSKDIVLRITEYIDNNSTCFAHMRCRHNVYKDAGKTTFYVGSELLQSTAKSEVNKQFAALLKEKHPAYAEMKKAHTQRYDDIAKGTVPKPVINPYALVDNALIDSMLALEMNQSNVTFFVHATIDAVKRISDSGVNECGLKLTHALIIGGMLEAVHSAYDTKLKVSSNTYGLITQYDIHQFKQFTFIYNQVPLAFWDYVWDIYFKIIAGVKSVMFTSVDKRFPDELKQSTFDNGEVASLNSPYGRKFSTATEHPFKKSAT